MERVACVDGGLRFVADQMNARHVCRCTALDKSVSSVFRGKHDNGDDGMLFHLSVVQGG